MNINQSIKPEYIQNLIFTIRGMQVMVDRDLAEMYSVSVKRLNEQVKRNIDRFPDMFRFQLSEDEYQNLVSQKATPSVDSQNANLENDSEDLRSQNVTSSDNSLRSHFATLDTGRGRHRKYLPYVFTEQGVSMLLT